MQRSEFERDRARVLHSHAFRRLADKTQILTPGQDDFPRTRLTHSLEVAQIAREIGAALGCDPDVTDTAGLAHDLGHPPFGHNGEAALNEVAAAIGGFEGNAQTFRILTRLEAKTLDAHGRPAGLNLTRAGLDAVCKYPWLARSPLARGSGKFGVYADDLPAFRWVRENRPAGQRCLEAQVMDWADDVAYSVHDLEDGVHPGHIRLDALNDADCLALCELAAEHYSERPVTELASLLEKLLRLPALAALRGFDGSYAAHAAAKRGTSELTGRFCQAAVGATWAQAGHAPVRRYQADLVVAPDVIAECALLKAMALLFVMRRPGIEPVLAGQRRLLAGLVECLVTKGESALSGLLRPAWRAAENDAQRLRVVIDQVAQLTDSAAARWHAEIVGERI